MNVARSFVLVGVLFLILGVLLGQYMAGSGDHSLAVLHAHINLLGFTLMTVFGLTYRLVPAMEGGMLARAHFWLHAIGTTGVIVMLFLLLSERISESAMVPVAPLSETLVLVGTLVFAWNLFKNF